MAASFFSGGSASSWWAHGPGSLLSYRAGPIVLGLIFGGHVVSSPWVTVLVHWCAFGLYPQGSEAFNAFVEVVRGGLQLFSVDLEMAINEWVLKLLASMDEQELAQQG